MENGIPGRVRRRGFRDREIAAHVRRCRDTMGWLDREKGDAEVLLDGRPIGRWTDLRVSRTLSAGTLRLSFLAGNRRVVLPVAAVREDDRSVSFALRGPGRRRSLLRVQWENVDLRERSSADGFDAAVPRWVSRIFPRGSIIGDERRSRLSDSLSRTVRRITVRNCASLVHILVVGPEEAGEPGDPLTQALLWLSVCGSPAPARLLLLVPDRSAPVLGGRARCLDPAALRVEIFSYGPTDAALESVTPAQPPGLPEENRDFRWPLLGDYRWSPLLGRVLNLAPRSIRRHPRFTDSDSLRISGLEFARVCGEARDRIEFGIGPAKTELCEANFDQLARLVDDVHYYRRPDSPDTQHVLYRVQSERWLESLILDDVDRLFPELQPASVYSQIPVYLGGESGRADVIGVDREGTLVVIELKVMADPGLPLQALDYRARVEEHNRCGDFESRGYFPGTGVTRRPPRACLLAPIFEFHDSTERLARYFDPSIELWKIGINEDWRGGVKVLLKRRLGCGAGR
jgi:hypothetical protein